MIGIHPANEILYARVSAQLDVVEQLPAGPGLHAALIELRGAAMDSAAAVRTTALWVKLIAHCEAEAMIPTVEAVGAADVLVFHSGYDANRVIAQEIAAMTNTTFGASMERVALVEQISRDHALGWEALDRGELTLAHLTRLASATHSWAPRVAQAVDTRLIPLAVERGWTPSRLAKEAAKAIIELDPDGAADRAANAKAEADVRLYPSQNETSTLVAAGDAVTLGQIMDAIEARATQLANEGSSLPAGLRRFTALADLVLGQQLSRPAVETVVTVDLTTLLGLNQHPGELSGYGPITADLARKLSNDATLRRLVTDPVTGAMIDLGRRSYAPSRHLRRVVNAQHRTCRFPGCARRAIDCDCDHDTPWSRGGRTDRENLHPLCRMHHNLKTRRLWHVDIDADGTEIWTSALGFRYTKSAATYPLELLEPPEDEPIPEERDTIPESAPDPPFPDEPLPAPPPLTDTEYDAVLDALDRNFGSYAERVYDTLRSVDLIA